MNKENAHLYLPLVKALSDGKKIQYRLLGCSEWETLDDRGGIDFCSPPGHYRIKPEPREWFLYRPEGCSDLIAYSKKVSSYQNGIRVREIIEE